MMAIDLVLAALFGLVIGSFLNVCIYRLPRDLSVVYPRSFCPECGTAIRASYNIPLLSFALLKGRCRDCSQPIGWRYPAVEAFTAVAYCVLVWRYGTTIEAFKWAVFCSAMIGLFFTDLEERILPDEFTLGGLAAAVVFAFFVPVPSTLGDLVFSSISGWARELVKMAASAAILSLPVWALAAGYGRLRGKEAMGFGDVKLLALMGAFLGLEHGITALLVGSVAGSILGLILLVRMKGRALEYELPFGSFLCAGALLLPLARTLR